VLRGDVVVLRSGELGRRVVKRVVGLPGESVVVDHRGVRVDGVRLAEPYVLVHGGAGGSFSVPDGAYVVLGDNRARSSDSRSWRQPFVVRSAIEGRWVGRSGLGAVPVALP
jgi:signal peptidase I